MCILVVYTVSQEMCQMTFTTRTGFAKALWSRAFLQGYSPVDAKKFILFFSSSIQFSMIFHWLMFKIQFYAFLIPYIDSYFIHILSIVWVYQFINEKPLVNNFVQILCLLYKYTCYVNYIILLNKNRQTTPC